MIGFFVVGRLWCSSMNDVDEFFVVVICFVISWFCIGVKIGLLMMLCRCMFECYSWCVFMGK